MQDSPLFDFAHEATAVIKNDRLARQPRYSIKLKRQLFIEERFALFASICVQVSQKVFVQVYTGVASVFVLSNIA